MIRKTKQSIKKYPFAMFAATGVILALIFDLLNKHGITTALLIIVALSALVPAVIAANRTLKSGFFGINILLIVGLTTAIFTGEYWTAAVLALIVAGERPLIAWLRGSQSELIGASHTPFVRLMDRFSVVFTVFVLLVAGGIWAVTGDSGRFLEIIVIASPAPLVLASPLAFVTGLQQMKTRGTYIRSAGILERLAYAGTVIISKAGVLTNNQPTVELVKAFKGHTKSEVLHTAAALASQSTHPLSQAILKAAQVDGGVTKAKHAREVVGMGISGRQKGRTMLIGRAEFLESEGIEMPGTLAEPNKTTVYVAVGTGLIGSISFSDKLRTDADKLNPRLKKLGIGTLAIASNDVDKAVGDIAEQTGIKTFHSQLVAADKIKLVEAASSRPVVFIGDAHTDMAALTAAEVAITFGERLPVSDLTVEDGSLKTLLDAFTTARRTLRRAQFVSLFGLFATLALIAAASSGVFAPLQSAGLQALVLFMTVSTASYVNLKSA
jgi:P-type E1-E2 ATPase